MALKSPYLTKELLLKTESCLKGLGRTGELVRRLNAIIASYHYSISEVAKFYNTTNKTIRLWIKNFDNNGIEALSVSSGRGRKPILNEFELEEVKKIITSNSTITINILREKIAKKWGKEISKSCCHNIIKSCGFSYKTARKKHYKSDPNNQLAFKKTPKYGQKS